MVVSIWNVQVEVTYGKYIGGIGGFKLQNVGVWLKNTKIGTDMWLKMRQ